jgi:hypothetical protein
MKKTLILSIILVLSAFGGYYCFIKSDKKMLADFANEVVDESITADSIIEKYVKYTDKGKQNSLFVLNLIRREYKKEKGQIIIYASDEAKKTGRSIDQIKLNDKEKLYYIKFNKEINLPFIINSKSKIIVLLVLTKGDDTGTLCESRSDE